MWYDELLTLNWWQKYWWWWLLFVFLTWVVPELLAMVAAHVAGDKNIQDWTLSDTIRRWSAQYRWLAPIVVGTCAMLIWHWFAQLNKT